MTPQARIRRIGWLALLGICTLAYVLLLLKGHSVRSEVVNVERQIVRMEERNLLLETEFLTLSNQMQLARWNRVDFGYTAPRAEQFIDGERQLASFASPRANGAPEPIRLAGFNTGEELPEFPKLVSPLTGKPIEQDLLAPERRREGTRLAFALPDIPRPAGLEVAAAASGQ